MPFHTSNNELRQCLRTAQPPSKREAVKSRKTSTNLYSKKHKDQLQRQKCLQKQNAKERRVRENTSADPEEYFLVADEDPTDVSPIYSSVFTLVTLCSADFRSGRYLTPIMHRRNSRKLLSLSKAHAIWWRSWLCQLWSAHKPPRTVPNLGPSPNPNNNRVPVTVTLTLTSIRA